MEPMMTSYDGQSEPATGGPSMLAKTGVVLASAGLTFVTGFGLGFALRSLEGFFIGSLAGIILAAGLFRRRRWLALVVSVTTMLTCLSVNLMFTPGTRDARRAEGEQILGSMKGRVRVAYAKLDSHNDIRTLTGPIGQGGCGVPPEELKGKYFRVRDQVTITEQGRVLVAEPVQAESDGVCTLTFALTGGDGKFVWVRPWDSPPWFSED